MKKLPCLFLPFFIIMCLILTSCGTGSVEEAAEKQKKYWDSVDAAQGVATITWQDINDKNNNKVVSITGYLSLPGAMNTTLGTIDANLYEKAGQTTGFHIVATLPEGTTNNTVGKLKENYKPTDFKIKTNDGEIIAGEGAYVKITGVLSTKSAANGIALLYNVKKIEKP